MTYNPSIMRFFLTVEHPAWAHQFRKLICRLQSDGHEVMIAAIDKDGVCELLDKFGLKYKLIARTTGKNNLEKAWLLVTLTVKVLWLAWRFKPDLMFGRATPMMAISSFLLRKSHVIFEDTEHSTISLSFCRWFSSRIITPNSFRSDLGSKQVRVPLYKEAFYLHSNLFVPDGDVIRELGLTESEPFVLMRFVSWQADHDRGWRGLTLENRKRAVIELSRHAKVFISSELSLEPFFQPYQIKVPREKIHSFMYFASLIFGESSTMASEAALLGVHAIFCDFEGRGYTDEQEKRYGLVYNFKLDSESQYKAIEKAVELIQDPDLKSKGKEKGRRLNYEIIDGTEYMYKVLTEKSGGR